MSNLRQASSRSFHPRAERPCSFSAGRKPSPARPLLLSLLLLPLLPAYLFRDFWFDEVLTLLNFARLPGPAAIYHSYFIPNNQILHTVLLHYLIQLVPVPWCWRLLPLGCGLLMIWLLARDFAHGHREFYFVIAGWVVSAPFLLHATALRGYMTAALAVTAALVCACRYARRGGAGALLGWFTAAVSASAVMPSALAGTAAAGLYALPLLGRAWYRRKRFYLLLVTGLLGSVIFYLPILPRVLAAFALHEGWHSAPLSWLALLLGVWYCWPLLLPAALTGCRCRLRQWSHGLIVLLPLGAALLPVAPFPRVWWVLFPVFALLLTRGLRRRRFCKKPAALTVLGLLSLVCTLAGQLPAVRQAVSPLLAGAGQDDFVYPRYLRPEFCPGALARELHRRGLTGEERTIYATFDADPWALMWALQRPMAFDGPRGRVKNLPPGSVVIRCTGEPTPEAAGPAEKLFTMGIYTVELTGDREL